MLGFTIKTGHWTIPKPRSYTQNGGSICSGISSPVLGKKQVLPAPAEGGGKLVTGSAGTSHSVYVNVGPPPAGA